MEPSVGSPAGSQQRVRWYGALGTGALFAGTLTYVGLVDPHRTGSFFPTCPFKLLTGWDCPACGGLRMAHDLLHGDLGAAVVDNVALLVGIPVLVAWILWCRSRGRSAFTGPVAAVVAVIAISWTIARNMPGFPLVPTILGG